MNEWIHDAGMMTINRGDELTREVMQISEKIIKDTYNDNDLKFYWRPEIKMMPIIGSIEKDGSVIMGPEEETYVLHLEVICESEEELRDLDTKKYVHNQFSKAIYGE